MLLATYRRFPLTCLLAAHAVILMVGGAYTCARVPRGFWMQDALIAGLLAARLPAWGALAASAAINALAVLVVGRYRHAVLQGVRFRVTGRRVARLALAGRPATGRHRRC